MKFSSVVSLRPRATQNRLFYWSCFRTAAFALPFFTVEAPNVNREKPAIPPARHESRFRLRAATPSSSELSILALITAAAAVLRFHGLTTISFWSDEGVSIGIARLDWYNLVRILWRREANMSLYYLLLRAWLHLGNSEAFIRSLSVA